MKVFEQQVVKESISTYDYIALLYLLIPSSILLIFFGQLQYISIVLILALFVVIIKSIKIKNYNRITFKELLPTISLVGIIAAFSGVLPIYFYSNLDWAKHIAIFNTLIDYTWPVYIPREDGLYAMKYSMGFYILPSLISKIFGNIFLNFAIYANIVLGVFLALKLAFNKIEKWTLLLLSSIFFLFFSGADILGYYLANKNFNNLHITDDIEWWAVSGSVSSNITSIFWVPQHAIPSWISAMIIRNNIYWGIRNLGIIFFSTCLWSPFSIIGLLPTILYGLTKIEFKNIFTKVNLLFTPLLLILSFIYLSNGSSEIPYGFAWNRENFNLTLYIALIFFEFIVTPMIILFFERNNMLIWFNVIFLLILSIFYFGIGNDLLMRASLPAIGIISSEVSNIIIKSKSYYRRLIFILLFLLGLVVPILEISRAMLFTKKDYSNYDAHFFLNTIFSSQYFYKKTNEVNKKLVKNLNDLRFKTYGQGNFQGESRVVTSKNIVDSGFLTNKFILPKGIYYVESIISYESESYNKSSNSGHISIHGKRIINKIMSGKGNNQKFEGYIFSDGLPIQIAFGLGGWSKGKGFIQLNDIKIYEISQI